MKIDKRLVRPLTGLALDWSWSLLALLWVASSAVAMEQVLDQKVRGGDIGFNANFGRSAAIDDGVVVIGAPAVTNSENQDGAAYVFVQPPGGWEALPPDPTETFHAIKLIASDPEREDKLGNAVAIDGEVIAVGASSKLDTESGFNNSGVVYVYQAPAGGWGAVSGSLALTESARLQLAEPGSQAFFGHDIAIVGDEIVVSAPGYEADDDLSSRVGAVFVFEKPASGWSGTIGPVATLRGQFAQDNDRIGSALDYDGDTIVAGAIFDPSRTPRIYGYQKPASGWESRLRQNEDFRLDGSTGTDSNSLDNDAFALSGLVVQGDIVVAGAANYIDALAPENGPTGIAQLFERPANGWSSVAVNLPVASLRNSDSIENGGFGASIAIDGDLILIGRSTSFQSGDDDFGSAYLFQRPAGGWAGTIFEATKFTAIDSIANADLGNAVAIEDDTVLVTATYQGVRARGRAYLGTVAEQPLFADGFE